jgi:hypothetical protein
MMAFHRCLDHRAGLYAPGERNRSLRFMTSDVEPTAATLPSDRTTTVKANRATSENRMPHVDDWRTARSRNRST